MTKSFLTIGAATLAVLACQTHRPPGGSPGPRVGRGVAYDSLTSLGSTSNPVQARGPFGEREYLRRLRCADGAAPAFRRGGSIGAGGDGHILDVYSVACPSADSTSVFMDMYHGDARDRRPVPGFTVLAELPARTAPGCPPQAGPSADSSARYVYNYLEVDTPVRLINRPAQPIKVGFKAYATVGFVVDTLGRVEPGSLQMGEFIEARTRSAAESVVLGLRFAPAEHRPGCRVRQGTGLEIEFQ